MSHADIEGVLKYNGIWDVAIVAARFRKDGTLEYKIVTHLNPHMTKDQKKQDGAANLEQRKNPAFVQAFVDKAKAEVKKLNSDNDEPLLLSFGPDLERFGAIVSSSNDLVDSAASSPDAEHCC